MQTKYNKIPLGIGQEERHVLDVMTKLGKMIILAQDLEQHLGYTRKKANLILLTSENKHT